VRRSDEDLEQRLRELETLCRDIYVVAAEVGLPRPLLNRLWVVAGQGEPPQAFAVSAQDARAQATAASAADMAAPAPPPAPLPVMKRQRTALVVDDDPLMIELILRIMSKDNYALIRAMSGTEALERLNEIQSLDLLVTDVAMPAMSGPQLARRVRMKFPGVPVLFQTGFSDILFEDRPNLDDRSAFVEKPFTARGLLEAARMVMFNSLTPRE
jgi:two-component system cell cycle sensor histidine kinase/response regulator CckA